MDSKIFILKITCGKGVRFMNVNGKMMDLEGENMSRIEFDSEAKDKKVIEIALMQAQM